MDLKGYYRKLREVEAALPSDYVVVVSKETPDGGRAGTLTEVPRRVAAKLILDGAAELATEEQARKLRALVSEADDRGGANYAGRLDQGGVEEVNASRPEANRKK
jgi:hypothetical protein